MEPDILQKIDNVTEKLSKSQKKLADAIKEDYDKVAYLTASKLGEMVGVSESTVVRFASVLGFDGYPELQRAVQELVRMKLTPNQRIEITKMRFGHSDILESVMESDINRIRFTYETLDREGFYRSVDAILGAKNVYVLGARSTEFLAKLLAYNLGLIMDNVRFVVPTSSAEVFEQMFSVGEQDTVIAFSFPRYSSKIVNAARFAKNNKATVVAFTDSDTSPLAEHADYLITAQSDMASYMDTLVAPLSIINAIIVEITSKKGEEITARFDALEKIWDEYDVYTKR